MANKITIDNREFIVVDAGSNGDCLFKCIVKYYKNKDYGAFRKNIVDDVVL